MNKSLLRAGATTIFLALPPIAQRATRSLACLWVRLLPERKKADASNGFNRWLPPMADNSILTARMRMGHKMLLDIRALTEYPAYYTGDYDAKKMASILAMVQPNWTVVDVGANVGFWSIPLAKALTSGHLYCFEPVQSNYARLSQNITINNLNSERVTPYPFGLSDCCAKLDITLREDFEQGSSTGNAAIILTEGVDTEMKRIQIEVRTLDSLEMDRLDFIKLDIEGHEPFFLRGARRTIARFRPKILMEINNHYYLRRGEDPTEIFDSWMRENEYCCALEANGEWVVRSLAQRGRPITDVLLLPKQV